MKKLFFPAVIALLASCAQIKEETPLLPPPPEPEQEEQKTEIPGPGFKILTIEASQEASADSKTSYAGEVTFSWSVGDKISVLCNDGSANCWQTFTATTAAASSKFTAVVPDGVNLGSLDAKKVALYPADENHVYTSTASGEMSFHIPASRDFRAASGGHKETAIPMFAWGTDTDTYAFSNLTGAVKFTFTNVPSTAVKFVFTSGSSKLNGTFPLVYSGDIDLANSSNVKWNAADPADASEKPVTYYADVEEGTVSFYVPFATGSIWGYSHLELRDVATDTPLFTHNSVGTINVTKNRVVVLPNLTIPSFASAYGIDWSGVDASENASATYTGIRKMKATADSDYLYMYLEVDPSVLTKTHDYDHYINIYVADASGSTGYWGAEKYSRIGKQSWAVEEGNIAFTNWTAAFSSSNLLAHPSTWYYELRISRAYCPELSGTGTINVGVELDDMYYDGEFKRLNGYVPYGVIPTYGTAMYPVELPSTLALSFTEMDGEVANPERGMMSYSKFIFEGDAIPSVKNIPLDYTGESLAFMLFYMPDYLNKDLDDAAKTFIRAEFDKVRAANKKAVVRFAYEETWVENAQHEATPTQILAHNDQIASILSDNADILYVVQAGWLGTYGEWYYKTNNNGESKAGYEDYYLYTKDGSTVTDLNNNHKNLLDKMLTVVPSPIHIGMRTAFYKRYYLSPGSINSWTPISAWSATPGANQRLAFFNDGIRGSSSDVGTFNSSTDWNMWYSQGNWLACGGEMSYRSADDFAALPDSLKDCDKGIAAMRRQHLSYLHYSESNRFMVKWIGEGRMEDLKKCLGYRLVLGDVNLAYESLAADESVSYSIQIKNTGCAPVIYQRPFKLVLLHGATATELADLGDIRTISPGAGFITLSGSFDWPAAVSADDKLAIWLPDSHDTLEDNAAYSIHLANNEVTWSGGYNILHTF